MRIAKRVNGPYVVAGLALFVALSGSAYAVSKNSVTSKQVKNNSLTGADIRNEALTGADVNESTLSLPAGPTGPAGPAGSAGGGSSATSGPAGGALTGTFPNPGLAFNSVNAPQIATNAVQGGEIDSQAVSSSEIENGSLNGVDVGIAAGSVNFDPPPVAAGDCATSIVNLGTSAQVSDDVITVTMGDGWSPLLSVTTENIVTPGTVRLHVCNHAGSTINLGQKTVQYVAFDV